MVKKSSFFLQITSKDSDWVSCKFCKISVNIGKAEEYWCPRCENKLRGPRGDSDVGTGSTMNMIRGRR